MNREKFRKFDKSQRSSFTYWVWHWLAFNLTAKEWKAWKFHHLFHDIEKPFMKIFMDYKSVQKWHRLHNKHHLEYQHPEKRNWEDMVIDWECSGLTKYACPRNSIEEANFKLDEKTISWPDYQRFVATWGKMVKHKNNKDI